MIQQSKSTIIGAVQFPVFTGERVYMRSCTKDLPADLSRWQPTVDQLLIDRPADTRIFLTLDQKVVPAGKTHRRPGAHIDGVWCNDAGGYVHKKKHCMGTSAREQTLVLASDVEGCVSLEGEYVWGGREFLGGSLSEDEIAGLQRVRMLPMVGYAGDASAWAHLPLVLPVETARTLIRINICEH